jgi:hypothetical protein
MFLVAPGQEAAVIDSAIVHLWWLVNHHFHHFLTRLPRSQRPEYRTVRSEVDKLWSVVTGCKGPGSTC